MNVTSPAPRGTWGELIERDAGALVFQTPAWLDCICATGSYEDASRLYDTLDGRKLVLPMVRRRFRPGFFTLHAMPHGWGAGGLLCSSAVSAEEIAAVFVDLDRSGAVRTTIRPHPRTIGAWGAAAPSDVISTPRVTHVLDLDGGFDHIWAERFTSTTRWGVRKAGRSGLVVECDTSGKLVPVFYDLFLQWTTRRAKERRIPLALALRLARQREPLEKFQTVAKRLGDICRVWVASLDGRPVAASISLVFGTNAVYWRSYSHKELAGPTLANDLLQRAMIEDACRAGCRHYDMGESGGVASLMHFKSRFGATPQPYLEYCLERFPFSTALNQVYGATRWLEDKVFRSGRQLRG